MISGVFTKSRQATAAELLISGFTCKKVKGTDARNYVYLLVDCLRTDNVSQFIDTVKTFFSENPYDIQATNRSTESYYQSLIYCVFKLVGYETSAEERTNKGRIDLVVEATNSIYIFEMKVDKPAKTAIEQIKQRGYIEKFRMANQKLILVGRAFSSSERNISEYEVEDL